MKKNTINTALNINIQMIKVWIYFKAKHWVTNSNKYNLYCTRS